jgi:hypothetical protein
VAEAEVEEAVPEVAEASETEEIEVTEVIEVREAREASVAEAEVEVAEVKVPKKEVMLNPQAMPKNENPSLYLESNLTINSLIHKSQSLYMFTIFINSAYS